MRLFIRFVWSWRTCSFLHINSAREWHYATLHPGKKYLCHYFPLLRYVLVAFIAISTIFNIKNMLYMYVSDTKQGRAVSVFCKQSNNTFCRPDAYRLSATRDLQMKGTGHGTAGPCFAANSPRNSHLNQAKYFIRVRDKTQTMAGNSSFRKQKLSRSHRAPRTRIFSGFIDTLLTNTDSNVLLFMVFYFTKFWAY